jgi:hypothetical protein
MLGAGEPPTVLTHPDADHIYPYARRPARYFIVSQGRSGSSLLAAILEECGADFGPASDPGNWNSREIDRAIRSAHIATRNFGPDASGLARTAYRFWRSRAKRLLRAALSQADFSRNRWSTSILPLVERLGYRPVMIVSYRNPAEVALGDMMQLKNPPSTFMPAMLQAYIDSFYSLARYGGVVIDHDDLTDCDAVDWAHALAQVTGLPARNLLSARRRLLRPDRSPAAPAIWVPAEIENIGNAIASLSNHPLPPSIG